MIKLIKQDTVATTKAFHLIKISNEYFRVGLKDTDLHFIGEALEYYTKDQYDLNSLRGQSDVSFGYLKLSVLRLKEQEQNILLNEKELELNEKEKRIQYLIFLKTQEELIHQKTISEKTKLENEKHEAQVKLLSLEKNFQQKEINRQINMRNSFIAGFGVMLLFAGVFFIQRNNIKKGKKRSDELLLNILPAETAEELKNTGTTTAKDFNQVTVLFTDFKNFTAMSERLTAQELVNEINFCYSAFDNIITKHGIEKIKTIGDSYMCAGGLPVANKTNAEDTVRAAIGIRDFMLNEKQKREVEGKSFFEVRIGCNTGSVVAGIVGIKKYAYDIWGDTVNIASRMERTSEAGKVNISGSTYELVKNKFTCIHRGKIEAKNKGMIDMYFIES